MSNESNNPANGWKALLEKIKTNTKVQYGIIGGVLAVILIILIIVCVSCSNKEDTETNPEASQSEEVSDDTTQGTLEQTTDENILQLVNTYCNALETGDTAVLESVKNDVTEEEKIILETKANDIESIDNIQVYTRPGLTEGSYVVMIYDEVKFYGIDTKAPGLATNYVSTNEDGSLYIDNNIDETTMEYVKEVVAEDAIADYFNQVSVAYTEAVTADADLANYMNELDSKLDAAVAARQQEAEESAGEEEQPQTAEATSVNETVTTTTKVNVRASDSENADRIGQVEAGATLTRYEVKDNGWSKIDYNGQEGYIKSEFLQAEASSNENVEAAAEPEQTDESTDTEETTTADTTTATGKVTAKESVRVRASASASGDVLGMLYQGESCDLLMRQADGWCKISYNGKTGYVKTDYVDVSE